MSDQNVRPGPGWYPDPYGQAPLRWWDGAQWGAEVNGAPPVVPAGPPVRYAEVRPPIPPETPVNTIWVWLVILLPLASLLLTAAFNPIGGITNMIRDVGTTTDPLPNMASIYTPAYFLSVAAGWVSYGLGVLFSWFDYRELTRRGVVRPFHWAWSFLLWQLYTIGRAVIVRRVSGGRGAALIWATIVVTAITLIWAIALTAIIVAQIVQTVSHLPGIGA